jgi:polyisoprenoid-binding protein YceI
MSSTTETVLPHPNYRAGVWKSDAVHSEITFSVRHLAISKVRGTFERFDVTVVATDDPRETTVEATIDVASVNTKQKDRDNHLRTSDFFAIDQYPTWTFRSTEIVNDGDDFTLRGDLTMRGVTRPVTLTGEFGGLVTDGYGQTKAGFSATTKVNRKDFGINWNMALEGGGLTLGDDVTINLDLQLVLQP